MPQKSRLSIVVLAAGEGTRMKSNHPKVLFTVCGRPMLSYVLDAAASLSPDRIVVVLGHKGEKVEEAMMADWSKETAWRGELEFAWQPEQRGTGHAVMCAGDALPGADGDVMILYGDTPLITPELLQAFYQDYQDRAPALSLITNLLDDAGPYGRVVRNSDGDVLKIVEAKDVTPAEAGIREVNAGIYLAPKERLFSLLGRVTDNNAKHEFYLTDIVQLAAGDGLKVGGFVCDDAAMVQGINDRVGLAEAEDAKRRQVLRRLALSGVTVRDPSSTYIDAEVTIGQDTVIEPQTYIRGRTSIGSGCSIGPGAEIVGSKIGDGSKVWLSVVENSEIRENVQVGPYSHLRPNCLLMPGALVGNYAEIKNSSVGAGTKVHHHSYLGDSDVGENVNIGAGAITVNYDGAKKHRTTIEDGVFVGCNANLVAPVKIGKEAYVAAGSTINLEVPEGSLAIARERQVNKEGWVAKRKSKGR